MVLKQHCCMNKFCSQDILIIVTKMVNYCYICLYYYSTSESNCKKDIAGILDEIF
jgi:hypothetical protein